MKIMYSSPLKNLIVDVFTMLYIALNSLMPTTAIFIILYIIQKSLLFDDLFKLPIECDLKLFVVILLTITIIKAAMPIKSELVEK